MSASAPPVRWITTASGLNPARPVRKFAGQQPTHCLCISRSSGDGGEVTAFIRDDDSAFRARGGYRGRRRGSRHRQLAFLALLVIFRGDYGAQPQQVLKRVIPER